MQSAMNTGSRRSRRSRAALLKTIAAALIAVPAIALLALGIGEMAGGEPSGVQHLPEAAVLLALLVLAWRRPAFAGRLLVGLGGVLFVLWLALVLTRRDVDIWSAELLGWVVAAVVLFAGPVVAGVLLVRAAREDDATAA
jgi:hypothetical protein